MRVILAIVVIAVFAMLAPMGFDAIISENKERTDITNETWTPDAGNITELEDSNLEAAEYDQTVTVHDENDTEMTDGTDYEWFHDNGTVTALKGGDLDGDSSANITYGYDRPPAEQVTMSSILAQIPAVTGMLLPLGALLFLLLLVRGG